MRSDWMWVAAVLVGGSLLAAWADATQPEQSRAADVIVVGAGIAGISAALEGADRGGTVLVVDMASVFGGHAVMAEGGVSIVASPLQQSLGIEDSADLAYADFVRWGEDANEAWVRYYVDHSQPQIYEWVTSMGVQFADVLSRPGNSVPRFHRARGRGLGLVAPLYRAALRRGVAFMWNHEVTELLVEQGRVVGVATRDLRSGNARRLTARSVILATGGFQSNLSLLREHWPATLKFPETVLLGSGVNSTGRGHSLAQRAGAALVRMDHQWNYPWGLLDPRYPGMSRGLSAQNPVSIWVNAEGRRFVNELASPKIVVPILLEQQRATYWAIFDKQARPHMRVAGSDWIDAATIERLILDDPQLVKTAPSLSQLATTIGVPPEQLNGTVRRYNELVASGDDLDFGKFGASAERFRGLVYPAPAPTPIDTAPFHAIQFFLLTRKSMGGVSVDQNCRVVSEQGVVIPGLFAAGELTGLAGINGKAGLEGTFLGPSIVTGRVAARAAVPSITPPARSGALPAAGARSAAESSVPAPACTGCHDIATDVRRKRPGYWHFERVHTVVLSRGSACVTCHQELQPYAPGRHRIDRLAQIDVCTSCHGIP